MLSNSVLSVNEVATFYAKNHSLAEAAIAVLAAEQEPITLRGLLYRLISTGVLANLQREYRRLGSVATKLRESGTIPFTWIVDHLRATLSRGPRGRVWPITVTQCVSVTERISGPRCRITSKSSLKRMRLRESFNRSPPRGTRERSGAAVKEFVYFVASRVNPMARTRRRKKPATEEATEAAVATNLPATSNGSPGQPSAIPETSPTADVATMPSPATPQPPRSPRSARATTAETRRRIRQARRRQARRPRRRRTRRRCRFGWNGGRRRNWRTIPRTGDVIRKQIAALTDVIAEVGWAGASRSTTNARSD